MRFAWALPSGTFLPLLAFAAGFTDDREKSGSSNPSVSEASTVFRSPPGGGDGRQARRGALLLRHEWSGL